MKRSSILLPFFMLFACGNPPVKKQEMEISGEAIEFYGNTQGTTFALIVNDSINIEMEEIENILSNFDLALSSYMPNSTLTKLNEASYGRFSYEDEYNYFNRCYRMAQEVYELTNGDFDPTVYSLVDGWGFMKDVANIPDSSTVDSLRALTGFKNGHHFELIEREEGADTLPFEIFKKTATAKLDFNAIAQGLAVDVLAEYLDRNGATNYFVEIGGEIRVNGLNREGEPWRVGIDKPIENSTAEDRQLQEIIHLVGKSVATSGSYRKFYEEDGKKYAHTLDPHTGYPVTHNLLSATVVARNCAMADGMATAFMVMGVDKTKAFIKENRELKLEVYLIFINAKGRTETFSTRGFQKMIAA